MKRRSRESHADEDAEAHYANYFVVGHNAFEMMLEFGQHYEDESKPQVHTRIVAAPVYAKALLSLLKTAIAEYEKTFGTIAARETHE